MNELNTIIAQNIVSLRTGAKMTQAELAEALCYSDKAVSKWERAASVPDIATLKRIADTFGVTVDYIINEHDDVKPLPKEDIRARRNRKIMMLSFFGVWLAAVITLTVLWILDVPDFWLVAVAAVPLSILVLFILVCVFKETKFLFPTISALTFGALACAYIFMLVLLPKGENNFWQVFIIGIPAEIVEYLSCTFKGKKAFDSGKKAIKKITEKNKTEVSK